MFSKWLHIFKNSYFSTYSHTKVAANCAFRFIHYQNVKISLSSCFFLKLKSLRNLHRILNITVMMLIGDYKYDLSKNILPFIINFIKNIIFWNNLHNLFLCSCNLFQNICTQWHVWVKKIQSEAGLVKYCGGSVIMIENVVIQFNNLL